MPIKAVVFDVGNVLYHWSPRALYQRLIRDDQALDVFLRDVVTTDWHFQHDAGRPFCETSAELIAKFPQHEALIALWGPCFAETITGPVAGMHILVAQLAAQGTPLFAITNFSDEFWQPFVQRESQLFDRFGDIIVSGAEKLVKPDPAIYALARDRFGLASGEGYFIDDNADNVDAARRNGFAAHLFSDAETLMVEMRALGILSTEA
jgi:2-haloacid dehalogenase